ncbi:DUF3243 domain-containing protein [Fictibacillus sp. WQ 8-8]|uniref:DUF3243 domain-containing protein n=1 Tax=Fictibacillus sp. WQ 8-8 TaxID=2938788 RepID=UPI0021091C1C|nr:DUF3243 domain-containing protein [Fictibacillus sp. WQ 8-8]MCQ6267023.1 DUF3243 domain-containing protein [Fictibacillus sp. WQ 8-8]
MGNEEKHILHKDDTVNINKVDDTVGRISDERKDEILRNFSEFKSYLHTRVALGEKLGLDEETLAKAAQKVADHLAETEEPRNAEENLLKELWKAGDENQRHQLAHMLVKLVQ